MNTEIRQLQSSDFTNGFLEALESLRPTGLTADEAYDIFQNRPWNIRTFVLLENNRVVATATLVVEKKFIRRGGVCGHIEDVATHRDHQNKGYATRLLQHIIAEAKKEGCYKVILDCDPGLVGFYERTGFKPVGECMRIDL